MTCLCRIIHTHTHTHAQAQNHKIIKTAVNFTMDHNYDGFFVLYLLTPAHNQHYSQFRIYFLFDTVTVHCTHCSSYCFSLPTFPTKDYGLFNHLIMIFKRCLALFLISIDVNINWLRSKTISSHRMDTELHIYFAIRYWHTMYS